MNQENKSKCCGAEKDFLGRFAEKGDWCSKCGKPFIPQSLEEKKSFHDPCPYGNDDCPKCHIPPTDSNWEDKLAILITLRRFAKEKIVKNSVDEKSIADWWLNKMKEQREKMIESISEDITNYDEVYISEDVRKAINRMKFNLKSIIKNKE